MEGTLNEKPNLTEIPIEKIYKDRAIWLGSFLGGPLVAGYFIAENFKVFKDYEKAKTTWIIAIISTIIVFGTIFLIPENVNIPNQIIPLIYTGIAYYVAKHFQEQKIKDHVNNGGEFFNWYRTIGTALIGLLITVVAVITIFLFIDKATSSEITKEYGVMNNEIVFDNSVSAAEVDKIAVAFEKTTFFDNTVTKFAYLKKINNNYEISISCNKSIQNEREAQEPFVELRNDMQNLFPNNKIIFNLVVGNLDNVVKRLE